MNNGTPEKKAPSEQKSSLLEIDEKTKEKFKNTTNADAVRYIQLMKCWEEASLKSLGIV